MTFQQLEAVYWVSSLGSFSAASDRLFVTQSTISMRIRKLEKELGVDLFDRSSNTIQLTLSGLEFMQYARRILDLRTELVQNVASSDAFSGQVRLGVAEVVSSTWLPKLIESISAQYPKVRLEIEMALTEELVEALKRGTLDLILAPGKVPTTGLTTVTLGAVEFSWMASPVLGLGHVMRTARELAQWPLVGLSQQSYHHAVIEHWFRRSNVRCHYQIRCKSIAVAASMVVAGAGIAYLPIRCFQRELDAGQLELVETSAIKNVEFMAAMTADEINPLSMRISDLARQVSDFQQIDWH
ncbi:LysR family transcriptional regulator [Paenalcaligenes niemegkensis]|uniref:LysR family transcriptional regulator n=1 Tax=Paenalcaligenes niemegkensis TaxID=2895469 RepID=UPI001EE79AB0|nr:LysR family transcriptional regulator [Paenalcaligenes niemegkensis]MCQ9615727.1 LysR family transcriptional regulator [Paenalcaligenes niemegkensis]